MIKKIFLPVFIVTALLAVFFWFHYHEIGRTAAVDRYSNHEIGFEEILNPNEVEVNDSEDEAFLERSEVPLSNATSLPPIPEPIRDGRTQWAAYWQPFSPEEAAVYGRPIGPFTPPRVGIQVGHWQRSNLPEELSGLAYNSGAVVSGFSEEEVMYEIAVLVKASLEAAGIVVDLLPVTIPVDYQASAFITLHADGSNDTSISGYKTATPRTDFSGKAQALKEALDQSYEGVTGLEEDFAVTRRMTGYYAFNWRRYNHAIHPQTPAVIVETGFLSNVSDRNLLVNSPELAAKGISEGVLKFLNPTSQ